MPQQQDARKDRYPLFLVKRKRTGFYFLGCFATALVLSPCTAPAQESPEDRMRDALRQAVSEMRAAQDQAAQAQAQLQQAQADKAALQKQLDDANARLGAAPSIKQSDLDALKVQLQAAQQAGQSLQQQNAQLQSNVSSLSAAAQAREDAAHRAEAAARSTSTALSACKTANGKLIDVSETILHLYETQSFRALLMKSYEPVLGLYKVKLENIVQDYDDKIRDQEYIPPAR
jgi:septal ring factor EnvC (AmiA/AmiB activator)